MPKLRESKDAQLNKLIAATIKKYIILRDVSQEALAAKAQLSIATLSRRLNADVERFSIAELRRIIRALQIPGEEIANPIIGLYLQ